MKMQVRLGRVAAVATLANLLSRGHQATFRNLNAALPPMDKEPVFAIPEIDHHMISGRIGRVCRDDDLIRQVVDSPHDRTVGRRQDRLPPTVMAFERTGVSDMALPVPQNQ